MIITSPTLSRDRVEPSTDAIVESLDAYETVRLLSDVAVRVIVPSRIEVLAKGSKVIV